jgi:hypothetical protein
VDRAYRIIGTLEKLAHHIEEKFIPRIRAYKTHWRRLVLWGDSVILLGLLVIALLAGQWLGFRDGWEWKTPGWWNGSVSDLIWMGVLLLGATGVFAYLHFKIRHIAGQRVTSRIGKNFPPGPERERLCNAFVHNSRPWRSIFTRKPVGWGNRNRKRLHQVIAEVNEYVQTLNDAFTDPSGAHNGPEIPQTTPQTADMRARGGGDADRPERG